MKTTKIHTRLSAAASCAAVLLATLSLRAGDIGTAADREALFESIMDKTLNREAFSEIKNERLRLDVEQAMRSYRDEVVNAADEVELFYALVKLSNARRDQHLEVEEIDGGLSVAGAFAELARRMGFETHDDLRAPVRFAAGFSDPLHPLLFVSRVATDIDQFTGEQRVRVTDRVLSINGVPVDEFAKWAKPYFHSSTDPGFWHQLARYSTRVSPMLPPEFYHEQLELELENSEQETFIVRLPYREDDGLEWQRLNRSIDPGFQRRSGFDFESFALYEPRGDVRTLLLQWFRFDDDLVEAVDTLMRIAVREEWLDYDLIIDFTQSRGGSLGPYAIQRFSPHPFRTTLGNLRMSDVIPEFIVAEVEDLLKQGIVEDKELATGDDGTWRVDWLTGDVLRSYRAGDAYSNNVPFKLAHAPSDSDGILQPVEPHFRGNMVCWFGPGGGSHLDQISAILHDNGLAYTFGMPTAGYSNTWEWREDIEFPRSDQPVVRFMWTIGHTIRPDREVLEGNPADVDEWRPITRENFLSYYETMVELSRRKLRMMGEGSSPSARDDTSDGP